MWTPGKMRHIGRSKDGSRLVIVYKQIPGATASSPPSDPYHALVLYTDNLPNVDLVEVQILLQSHEGQNEEDFANALHKKHLLGHFHEKGLLHKLHIDEIELLPEPNVAIKLRDIINGMNAAKGKSSLGESVFEPKVLGQTETAQVSAVVQPAVVTPSVNMVVAPKLSLQEKKATAQNFLLQANMLQAEANKKFSEAYKLNPLLKPTAFKKKGPRKPKVTSGTDNG